MSLPAYTDSHYVVKHKLFSLIHVKLFVLDSQEKLVMCVTKKAFKFREDIRLFADEKETQPVLNIRARQVIDFGATYDMIDPVTQQRIGALRRNGLRSMLRDQWVFLNYDDQPVGIIEEDSWLLAIVRRFLFNLVPQKYHATFNDRPVARFVRHISLLRSALSIHIEPGTADVIDPRALLATGIMLSIVEGRQD